jgi:hypothetical protein
VLAVLTGAAFLAGTLLADDGPAGKAPGGDDPAEVVAELKRRQELLFKDLTKIESAARDVRSIRDTRASGEYIISAEEKKLERQGRADLHIFMERCRNDTLETLALFDRVLASGRYVEPLRRVFGMALDTLVIVEWEDVAIDTIIDEISSAYGVPMHIKGDIDRRRSITLAGEMSLVSILFNLENVANGQFVVKDDVVWFERARPAAAKTAKDGADGAEKK